MHILDRVGNLAKVKSMPNHRVVWRDSRLFHFKTIADSCSSEQEEAVLIMELSSPTWLKPGKTSCESKIDRVQMKKETGYLRVSYFTDY